MLSRRSIVLLPVALTTACATTRGNVDFASVDETGSFRPPRPTLVYVGAPDCPYCREWKGDAFGSLKSSALWQKIDFIELQSPTLQVAWFNEGNWPPQLRWIRDGSRRRAKNAVPFFAAVHGNRVLAAASGTKGWSATVLPALENEAKA